MNKRTALLIAAGLSLVATGPAPGSSKPCRDRNGRVIPCSKVRKATPRCKDAKGRFVSCPTPADGDPAGKNGSGA